MNKVKIALADDHVLLRNGLAGLITNLGYTVLLECSTGKELTEKLDKNNLPDVVLMDINMPEMDGYETTAWLKTHYPLLNVLALSMYDDENAIIRMLRNGARGYIMKDSDPLELKRAIDDIVEKGVHYSELVTGKLLHSIYNVNGNAGHSQQLLELNEREIEFLKLASTEMTYREIAEHMHLSPRTIDGYRDSLFEKLNIKNRVGLVLYAIKNGIVQLN
ncbi:MAG: response regulator transcription factor [Bacteroidetes bacterium]|nr:response regulator transcription factor [Bacteroidota bacterium]